MDNRVTLRNKDSGRSRTVTRIAAGVVIGIFLSACGRQRVVSFGKLLRQDAFTQRRGDEAA